MNLGRQFDGTRESQAHRRASQYHRDAYGSGGVQGGYANDVRMSRTVERAVNEGLWDDQDAGAVEEGGGIPPAESIRENVLPGGKNVPPRQAGQMLPETYDDSLSMLMSRHRK